MNNSKTDNGLNLLKVQTMVEQNIKIENLDNIDKFINKNKESFAVAYLVNEIMIGIYKNNEFIFHDNKSIGNIKFLKRIRIFNDEEELLIWRADTSLKGRYRKDINENSDNNAVNDDSVKESFCIEAYQILFGTKAKKDKYNGDISYKNFNSNDNSNDASADNSNMNKNNAANVNFTTIYEERGTELILPGLWRANDRKERVAIQTRHYIDYINDIQATYIDARFVNFVQLPTISKKDI